MGGVGVDQLDRDTLRMKVSGQCATDRPGTYY
jgi:hypothetical protein